MTKKIILLIISICSFQFSCTVGEVHEKIDHQDSSEFDMNNKHKLKPIERKIEISIYGEMVDAVYKEMTILSKNSDTDTHCEWLGKYVSKIEKKLEKAYPELKGRMTTIGYTKMNLEFYAIEENGNCRKVQKNSMSEKVKLKLEGVMSCTKPNDPNLIRPAGYSNSVSKFHPKFKETPCFVETWYK